MGCFNFREGPGGGFGWTPFRLPSLRLQQISPQLLGLIVGVMAAVWLASGAYTVGPDQRGIVLRFGKHVATTGSIGVALSSRSRPTAEGD